MRIFAKCEFSHNANFAQNANFSHANFRKMRIYAKCEFSQNANFSHANFRKMRIYAKCEFMRNANFRKMRICCVFSIHSRAFINPDHREIILSLYCARRKSAIFSAPIIISLLQKLIFNFEHFNLAFTKLTTISFLSEKHRLNRIKKNKQKWFPHRQSRDSVFRIPQRIFFRKEIFSP
jgi:uncharacterized protein YjbI with pentapeptide repeats